MQTEYLLEIEYSKVELFHLDARASMHQGRFQEPHYCLLSPPPITTLITLQRLIYTLISQLIMHSLFQSLPSSPQILFQSLLNHYRILLHPFSVSLLK